MKKRSSDMSKDKRVRNRALVAVTAIITVLAIVLSCVLCFGTNPKIIDAPIGNTVHTSTTYSNKTGDVTTILNNDDVITYSAGASYSITLPVGEYKLEAYGAQGGYGYGRTTDSDTTIGSSANNAGGLGGYTVAKYVITVNTTVYISVGSQGSNGSTSTSTTNAGGYNGGGSSQYISSAGGGATHFATASGLLSTLSGNQGAVLIVAGGGGGTQTTTSNRTGGAGAGGNNNGGISTQTTYGSGACGGGTTGPHAVACGNTDSADSTKGSFGQGGAGSRGSDGFGGGGGGGGWYGGCGVISDSSKIDEKGAGGGSGYIKEGLTDLGSQSGVQSGNGSAKITAIQVNQAPKTRNKTVAGQKRGSDTITTITPDDLATDPDATKTTLYYTDGTASDLTAFTTTANTGLYVKNSSGTARLATDYLDWEWTDKQTLKITGYKRYPRKDVDGSTENGKLPLYVKIRDSYGTTAQHLFSEIPFTLTIPASTVDKVSDTITTTAGDYRVGMSTTQTLDANGDAPTGELYNPSGKNRYTAFIDVSLRIGEPFTIRASDLLSGLYSGDRTVISINNTTGLVKPSGADTRKYKINELDGDSGYTGHAVTSYSAAKAQIANAYDQLSITTISPEPGYKTIPVKLYVAEKTTAYGASYNNTVPDIGVVDMDIVFRMENSRPTVNGNNVVDLAVGEQKTLNLSQYFADADGAITSATHTITKVVVPANEIVILDRHALVVNTPGYNVGAESYSQTSTEFLTTATTGVETGFDQGIVYNATDGTTDVSTTAFMRFTYGNDSINVVGLRSSYSQYKSTRANPQGHFYLMLHIEDKCEVNDKGIWLPLAFRVGNTTSYSPVSTTENPGAVTGQGSTNIYPAADGGVGESYYFAPMAIAYNGMHVVGEYRNASGALTSDGLQPLGTDGDNYTTETGTVENALDGRYGKLNELLRLSAATTPASIVNSVSTDEYATGTDEEGDYVRNRYIIARYINIYIAKSKIASSAYSGGRVVANAGGTNGVDGYKHVTLEEEDDYYIVKGLKITLRSATMNRYLYATAGVTDVTDNTKSGIEIAIRVRNSGPQAYASGSSNVATFQSANNDNAYSSYSYDPNDANSIPTVTYRIPLGATVVVTPYDFVYDADINVAYGTAVQPTGGFTLNGINGRFDVSNGLLSTEMPASANNTAFNGVFDSATYGSASYLDGIASNEGMLKQLEKTVTARKASTGTSGTAVGSATTDSAQLPGDRLYFSRGSSDDAYTYSPTGCAFLNTQTNTSNFVTLSYGNRVRIGSNTFDLDYVIFTAVTRTMQPAWIDLTVRDRYGDSSDGSGSVQIRVVIEVVNTAPEVKKPDRYCELAVTAITDGEITVTPTSVQLTVDGNGTGTGLMKDIDTDTPEFVTPRGTLIANTPNLATIYKNITSFSSVEAKYTTDDGTATGRSLNEYMTAALVTQSMLTVSAKSSTKAIESGVFVYFFATDGNGGTSLGYVRIEVLNTMPKMNTSDVDGFDPADPLWSVESTSMADFSRSRYIVGGDGTAAALKNTRGAIDADIRKIATDADGLHNLTVLSPRKDGAEGAFEYVNLDLTNGVTETALNNAVPEVIRSTAFGSGNAPAVMVSFLKRKENDEGELTDVIEQTTELPTGYSAKIIYYVNGAWIERADVISGILAGTYELDTFFDESGRWIYADWALSLTAQDGFATGERIVITLSVRDQAALGGDTAHKTTAYNSDRLISTRVDVDGSITATVFQAISRTGIRTSDEYAKYNDYYVVELNNKIYVPTYDGDKNSTYTTAKSTLAYNTENGNNKLSDTGTTTIKTRAAGGKDNTLAGTNSGDEYNAATIDSVAGAYKYPRVIEIPADTVKRSTTDTHLPEKEVFVPMSFFGQLSDIVSITEDTKEVVYRDDFVGYETGSSSAFSVGNLDQIKNAITLSDGVSVWEGSLGQLGSNPYINIDAFEIGVTEGLTRANSVENAYSSMYYNNRLSVPTVNNDDDLLGYEKNADNKNNFVGDGRIMYLDEQATRLQEHNFGLVFSKKDVRTGTRNLTLTVKLARSTNSGGNRTNIIKDRGDDCKTVTVNIHVENSKIDLSPTETGDLKYDGETYYCDVTMSAASTQEFALVRKDESTGTVETLGQDNNNTHVNAKKIVYTDIDYNSGYDDTTHSNYRDRAYFLADSFAQFGSWSDEVTRNRVTAVAEGGTALVNTASSEQAKNSMKHYFGTSSIADIANVANSYQPNRGKYGSNTNQNPNGTEGYSSYFTASLSEGGRVLNIMSSRKTLINELVFDELAADKGRALTRDEVEAEYTARGLVATYDGASANEIMPTRAYYPFKVLVYDSCGVGRNDASFVAVEIRITITNATPTLKNVGTPIKNGNTVTSREYGIDLAVGSTARINLYDIVSDADIYVFSEGGYYALATKAQFVNAARGVDRDSGDYLDSPFAHDKYLNGATYNKDEVLIKSGGGYYRDGGGFALSSDTTRDVIMWMETSGSGALTSETVPTSNNIAFTVNRRTTAKFNGDSVSVNEYRFTLRFYDSLGIATPIDFTFVINITNQTPTLTATTRNFTMRAGDDLTVLTTYYDTFIGGSEYLTNDVSTSGSEAYKNSATRGDYCARANASDYGEFNGDGRNNATGRADNGQYKYWLYKDITSTYASSGENSLIYDSTNYDRGKHMGYLALADDDTPWRLRITSVKCGSQKIRFEDAFKLTAETDGNNAQPQLIGVRIIAGSACVNEPVTITLSDGENGVVSVTLYITIVSSKPVARDASDDSDVAEIKKAHLETTGTRGVYKLYTVPNGRQTLRDENTGETIAYDDFNVSGVSGTTRAYSKTTIELGRVAKDPDGDTETEKMTLYRDGSFTVNGVELVRNGNRIYRADYFDIVVANDGKSFTLTATGYNPDAKSSGYETLTFTIADAGNGDYANTLKITIQVYTLYSDMTNPTVGALNVPGYTEYLKGSNKITVKSYDEYYSGTDQTPTPYTFVSHTGTASSPVADRDAINAVEQPTYTTRLYAFIETDSETQEWKRLSETVLNGMLERNTQSRTFALSSIAAARPYLIGGIDLDGKDIVAANDARTRRDEVTRYADFEFTAGGTQILFTPKTATFDREILLYIEVEKQMGMRASSREGAVMRAGTLFRLEVADSAPNAVRDLNAPEGSNFTAAGAKDDVITFKIHDPSDPYGALFTDSDADDIVTIAPFTAADYETALRTALESDPDLDWAAADGKPRAFDVEVDEALGTLAIRINRRMDSFDAQSGKYRNEVTFPVTFIGRDRGGATRQTTIMLTVQNRQALAKDELGMSYDTATGAGYTITVTESGEYVIDAQVKYGTPLDIPLDAFMQDPDGTNDSFMFAGLAAGSSDSLIYPYSYLGDTVQTAYWYETTNGVANPDSRKALATVEAVGADKWHRTGIRVTAADTTRSLSAKTLVRVIDRAGDVDNATEGVYLTLNIVILNEAPYVKTGMESSTVVLMGSDTRQPTGMLMFIGDFVADANESDVTGDAASINSATYLRIFSQNLLDASAVYSTKYETTGEDTGSGKSVTSSALFNVTIPNTLPEDLLRELQESGKADINKDTSNLFNQWFVIMPKEGYYGEGAFEITVTDGNANTNYDTLTTTFRINVRVMCDPDEAAATLNPVEIACGKTKTLDIATLMPDYENKILDMANDNGTGAPANTFSQSEFYSITSMQLQNSSDAGIVTLQRVNDSAVWTVTAGNQITFDPIRVNVTYALNSDPSKTYSKYYWLSVITNQAPKFKFDNAVLTFVRYDRNGDNLTDLDDSNSITLEVWQLFDDPDDATGMAMQFVSVSSQTPSLVKATLSEDKRYLTLTFAACGEAQITVEVADETGTPTTFTFTAKNEDMPEGSLWLKLAASFETHKVVWIAIICSVALLIILLIVIIAIVVKKKRAREELEALLISEMEIEEQMLRLAGGPSPTDYQSYGYLPPTAGADLNPNMLIGSGEAPNPDLAALPQGNGETPVDLGDAPEGDM